MFSRFTIYISLLILVLCCASKAPNIMYILLDDLGWTDISAQGGIYSTPALDELYYKSVRLDKHYIHLMCSPSRSQIITGRYAMNMGFGKMSPWDYTEIGGIPIGQPTIANWLRDFGNYDTYAVGKWHMGYAYQGMTPLHRGFNHFYGFYQGAIHYDTKKYIDVRFGDSNHYDFWEDGKPATIEASTTINTMEYYKNKVVEYLEDYAYNLEQSKKRNKDPFYMYIALQSMHVPFSDLKRSKYARNCKEHSAWQHKYCMYIMLTDEVVGTIINQLVSLGLYDDTLIVFTSDNGADISKTGCNYPLRGTKGSIFDGNLRTIALVSGGVIPTSLHNTMRTSLFSSLDWTPTLLEFSGLLSKISTDDYSWDGINQYSMIMNGDDAVSDDEKRSEIILNIGLRSLESASVVFEYQNSLYKYFARVRKIDNWAYKKVDGWCEPLSAEDSSGWNIIVDDADAMPNAQDCDDKYLFNLTGDERELTNMLYTTHCGSKTETESKSKVKSIVHYAKSMLKNFMENSDLYSEHISCLWNRLPEGMPSLFGNNSFIAPFLTKSQYFKHLEVCFKSEAEDGNSISDNLKYLYFNEWTVPEQQAKNEVIIDTMNKEKDGYFQHFKLLLVSIVLSIMLIVLCCAYDRMQCCTKKLQNITVQTLLETSIVSSEYDDGYGTL